MMFQPYAHGLMLTHYSVKVNCTFSDWYRRDFISLAFPRQINLGGYSTESWLGRNTRSISRSTEIYVSKERPFSTLEALA
jgi:hypothetical protein